MSLRLLLVLAAISTTAPAQAASPDDYVPASEARFSGGVAEPVPAEPWWERLGDPALTEAVETAMDGNLDLERLRAVQRQSEATALQSFSALTPTVSANLSTTIAPTDSLGFGFIPPGGTGGGDPDRPKEYYNGTATLDAQWGLDVFGRNGATWRAAQRDVSASRDELDNLAGSTAQLVANAYLDVVAAKERVSVIERQIATNAELLEVLELRYERGDATSLDVLQQRQSLATSQSQLPTARLVAETTSQRLAVLLGRSPIAPPETSGTLPDLSGEPIVGTPAELVDNRPDLRAEAARLKGTRDRRWAAHASLLPTISATARAGNQFIDLGELNDQFFWNVGFSASVPIFGGGRNLGAIKQAHAAHDAQAATFHASVLTAQQQVEGALSQERLQRESVDALRAQLQAAREASETARAQYLEGLAPFINVQNALAREQAAELTLLQGRRDLVSARIALHTALGGPWTRELGTHTSTSSESEAPR